MATQSIDDPAERLSGAEHAYLALRDRIIRLELKPGEVLSEDALSQSLSIGRTPVREAIRRLSREGLVVVLPRRGTLVSEIHVRHPIHVNEVRLVLEPLAARLAAERANEQDRSAIQTLQTELEGTHAGTPWEEAVALDGDAHRLVYQAAHNPLLAETLDTYYNLACRIWYAMLDQIPDSMVDELNRHSEILAAVSAGDSGTAEELSRNHVTLANAYQF